MFNKKLLTVLCYFVAALLALKVVLLIAMFVWSFFGVPPVQVFDNKVATLIKFLLLFQELGTTVFFYVINSGVKQFLAKK